MDATYKTTKYAIPLFFVWVRTNVDYKVVEEFMTQYEDEQSVGEGIISKATVIILQPSPTGFARNLNSKAGSLG